ncbi:MAG: type II secretion system F family protein [Proteobacteria bacterium]|nr:type II secretion system F family protein [Pseudomonadota bacterium]
MPDLSLTVGLVGAFIAMMCGVIAVPVLVSRGRDRRTIRVDAVRRRWAHSIADASGAVAQIKRDDSSGKFQLLERLAKRVVPRRDNLRQRLARTGKRIPLGTFFAASLASAAIAFAITGFVFSFPPLMAVFAAIVAGVGVPNYYVSRLANRRAKKFTAQFPEAIDLIVRGLKSGLPVSESIRMVGEEMLEPVGTEFKSITDGQVLGQTLETAMWEAARRVDTAEFKFFVISLSVQRETGGNLAETLQNLSDILRQRRHMRQKVKALSSEAKSSAMIIGALPFIMFGLLLLVNSEYVLQLFTDPRGHIMIGIGLGSMTIGVLVMARMVKFKI